MEQVMSESENCDQGEPILQRKGFLSPVVDIFLSLRLRPLLIVSLYSFLVFPLFRVLVFLASREAVQDTTVWEIGVCFGYGFQFDAVVVGYALLPMVLALGLVPARSLSNRIFQRSVTIYAMLVMTLVMVVEIVNAVFMVEFRRRLNWASLNYPKYYHETAKFIWETYHYWLFLIAPALAGGIYLAYRLLRSYCWRGRLTFNSPRKRLALTAVTVALCVVACRPTLGRYPLRPGSEEHSSNNFVNQASTNSWFSLWHALMSWFEDGEDEEKYYELPSVAEAQKAVKSLLFQPGDQAAPTRTRPLQRRVVTGREMRDMNVVVIIMEGQSNEPVGALGYGQSHTPELDEICAGGMFFEQLYATGARTSRGVTGVLVGHPDLGGISLLERKEAVGKFQTLPGVMRTRGHRTMFITGGSPDYDNMKGFFTAGGVETVVGQKQIGPQHAGAFGVPDEMTFRKAHEMFVAMGDERFFAAILTISNHQPYTIPRGRTEMLPEDSELNAILNAYRYADWALGQFFREARDADYFDNTIFVIVSDHGHGEFLDRKLAIDVPGYRIPCVFYAPGIISPQTVSTIASQTDIAPTLLGILGGTYEHSFLGRDILRVDPGDGFALLHEDRHLAFVRPGRTWITGPINRRDTPRAVPKMHYLDAFGMQPIPGDLQDRTDTQNMRRDLLSLYGVALWQYLDVKKKGN